MGSFLSMNQALSLNLAWEFTLSGRFFLKVSLGSFISVYM